MNETPPLRLVIVDDSPDIRRLVELWLEETPVRLVGQADDCEMAFNVVERQRPDVVVMDFHMPGRDGVECTTELVRRHPGLIVIAFTSTDDPKVQDAMRAAGALAHFHKTRLADLVEFLKSPELADVVRG